MNKNKISSLLLFVIITLLTSNGYSQTVIKGIIKDNKTLIGIKNAVVKIKGSNSSTQTNDKGAYTISAKTTDVLIYSAIGYESQKITVGSQSQIDVQLFSTNLGLRHSMSVDTTADSLSQYHLFTDGKFWLGDTTFSQNIGRMAGFDNTGINSINIGTQTGRFNEGFNSINIGYYAGKYNQNQQAVNIGHQTGMYNKGYQAVNIGNKAGQYSKQNFNVNIGPYAGVNNDGYANINIGFESGQKTGADNSIHIGISAGANDSTSNNVLIGYKAGENNNIGAKSIAIGSLAGQNNKGENVIALGELSGLNNLGNFAILMGYNAGSNNIGEQSIGIGYNSLMSNSGFGNIAIGYGAGEKNTSGSRNTLLGTNAGSVNTSGTNNTYLGWRAGFLQDGGIGNTFVGESANDQSISGDDNTLVGREAFHDNYTGSYNVSIGSYSMHGAQNIKASEMVSGKTYSVRDLGSPPIDLIPLGASNNLLGTVFIYNGNAIPTNDALVRDIDYNPVDNIAIGHMAGKAVGAGSGNIFIGANVGSDYSQYGKSNKLMIDNKNTLTPLIGGDFSTKELEIGGVLKFIVQYPPSGVGVNNGSFFYGTDGALYFKGGAGTVTLIANP
jgi:hypothetical protein